MPGIKRTISTPKILTPTIQEVRKFAAQYPDKFIHHCLKVVDKEAGVKPFHYNWSQRRIAAIIREEEKAGRPLRLFILKSRQIGSSTMIAARFFVQTWAMDNLEALILSQQEERSEELLQRVKFFYANLDPALKLALSGDSKSGIQYSDTRAKMSILSARARDAAKGGTKQRVLLSEWCYYKACVDVLTEFQQPVGYLPNTEIVIESTGSDYGGEAHMYWKKVRAGKTPYRAVFLPWQEDPNCTVEFESDQQRDLLVKMAFEYEPRLEDRMKHHKLTAGQIVYAHRVLRNQCNGDYEGKYLQYYPCNEDEAWRSHGISYFGIENVNSLRRQCEEFPCELLVFNEKVTMQDEFEYLDGFTRLQQLDENESRCFIKKWKDPHPKGDYVISGDSAEGLEDGNFSSSFVVDLNTYEMVAEFHGRCRPDEHARVMASLGYVYNTAMLAPEVNSPGNVTLFELQRMQYPNIFRWKIMDNHKPTDSIKLGWQTNYSSRPNMLSLAKRLVEDIAQGRVRMPGIIKSRELCNEMARFAIDPSTGKPEALPGANDDRVMAWSIAIIVGVQESYGTDRDILSLYKEQDGEYKPNIVNPDQFKYEPKDVIARLEGAKIKTPWDMRRGIYE